MSGLTPPDPPNFLPFQKWNMDLQAHNAVDVHAEQATPLRIKVGDESHDEPTTYQSLVEEVRKLKRGQVNHENKIDGLKNLLSKYFIDKHWNPALSAIVENVGYDRLSTPRPNGIINGGFQSWNVALTTPNGWTVTGAGGNVSRVTARTGAFQNEYGCRIQTAGASVSIARSDIRFQPGSIHSLAGWVKIAAAITVTITVTTNSATDTPQVLSLTGGLSGVGAADWFHFPRIGSYQLVFTPNSDATTMTLTLQVSANAGDATFSSFSLGPGPMRDADLFYPTPEDLSVQPALTVQTTTITSNQNNFAVNGYTWQRFNCTTASTITGMTPLNDNQIMLCTNVGTTPLSFADQSGSSSAANQIVTGTGATVVMAPAQSMRFVYDGASTKWRLLY